jgi:hypothetical protein
MIRVEVSFLIPSTNKIHLYGVKGEKKRVALDYLGYFFNKKRFLWHTGK